MKQLKRFPSRFRVFVLAFYFNCSTIWTIREIDGEQFSRSEQHLFDSNVMMNNYPCVF